MNMPNQYCHGRSKCTCGKGQSLCDQTCFDLVWVTTYIGLPDMQYRDVVTYGINKEIARDKADAELLRIYGKDVFDCLGTNQRDSDNN